MIQGVSGDPEVLRASSLFTRFLLPQVSEESCSGSDGGAGSDEVLRETFDVLELLFRTAFHAMAACHLLDVGRCALAPTDAHA